jgi:AhpD family alkylhydroperoxidase
MEPRIHYAKVAPGVIEAMLNLSSYLHKSGLEESLVNLVCLRASQVNGCAYCIDMHWKDSRRHVSAREGEEDRVIQFKALSTLPGEYSGSRTVWRSSAATRTPGGSRRARRESIETRSRRNFSASSCRPSHGDD